MKFSEKQLTEIKLSIIELGGEVVSTSFKGKPDYVVVPVFYAEIKQTGSEVYINLYFLSRYFFNIIF